MGFPARTPVVGILEKIRTGFKRLFLFQQSQHGGFVWEKIPCHGTPDFYLKKSRAEGPYFPRCSFRVRKAGQATIFVVF